MLHLMQTGTAERRYSAGSLGGGVVGSVARARSSGLQGPPVGRRRDGLVGPPQSQQPGLMPGLADELQTYGQAIGQPRRDRQPG